MPKIEIELDELQGIQARLERAQQDCTRLEQKLNILNEEQLVKRANQLANQLAENYVSGIFKILGFENTSVEIRENLVERFGEKWWSNEEVRFVYGASVTNDFTSAFMSIGVNFDKMRKRELLPSLPELNE